MFLLTLQNNTYKPLPVNGSHDGNSKIVIHGILQIESHSNNLFLRTPLNKFIIIIDKKGNVKTTIGPENSKLVPHPQEPISFALFNSKLMLLHEDKKTITKYIGKKLDSEYKLKSYYIESNKTSNAFFFNNENIVVQATPRSRALGSIMNNQGVHQITVGKILPIDPEILRSNPATNDTLIRGNEQMIFLLWKYRPIMSIYDINGNHIEDIELEIPPLEKIEITSPLFYDFKFVNNSFFILCQNGKLYKYNYDNRTITESSYEINGNKVRFRSFAFTESGDLFLGHPYLKWGHDLWYVPDFIQKFQ